MTNQARFTINSLLEGKSALVHITPVAPDGTLLGSPVPGLQGSKGLGLEIENIAALPDAGDYSQHEFYFCQFHAVRDCLLHQRAQNKGGLSRPPRGQACHHQIRGGEQPAGRLSKHRDQFRWRRQTRPSRLPLIDQSYGDNRRGHLFLAGRACLAGAGCRSRNRRGSRSPPNSEIFAQNQDFCVSGFVVVVGSLRIGALESP